MLPAHKHRSRRGRCGAGVALLSCLLALIGPYAVRAAGRPLLGGSLTWEVNRNFRAGARTVSLTLKTAWKLLDSDQCNHLLGNKVSKCTTPAPEPMARLGRLCYYLCDTKDCKGIRDDRHLNTSHVNDFTVEHFDPVLKYLSGSMTIVNMFAFLCFDETDPVAVGPVAGTSTAWYGEDSPESLLVHLQPSFAGAATPTAQIGRYYGQAFLSKFGGTIGAGTIGRKARLLSTFVQFCCHQCAESVVQQVETSCDDRVAPNTRLRNYYSPKPNVPFVYCATANPHEQFLLGERQMQYKV